MRGFMCRASAGLSADTVVPDPTNPQAFNRYSYVANNPIGLTDPTGHYFESWWDAASIVVGVGSLGYNLYNGNYTDAAMDVGGLAVDGIALALPVVPGGASVAIKAGRAATKADDVIDVGAMAAKYGDEALQLADEAAAVASDYMDEAAETFNEAVECASGLFNSFSADTVVLTADGYMPISMVEVGTWVLAFNEETGERGYYPVTQLISHIDLEVVYLTIEGEVILTTPAHPFYTSEGVWVEAGELEIGTEIQTAEGTTGTVESVNVVESHIRMYNFTVAVAHTYFVGPLCDYNK